MNRPLPSARAPPPAQYSGWACRPLRTRCPPKRVDYELTGPGRSIVERICDLIDLIDAIYDQLPGIVAHQRAHASGSASEAGEDGSSHGSAHRALDAMAIAALAKCAMLGGCTTAWRRS